MMTVLAAQNGDRESYDKLRTTADDKANRFTALAGQAWMAVTLAHSSGMYRSGFNFPWNGVDPSKFSISDLAHVYQQVPSAAKPAILEYIWKREDIPKIDRLDFMMKVMKTDKSLDGVEYAARHFLEGTGRAQKVVPMDLDSISSWWDEHRNEFEGK